ncbi:putative quinol monooxygenase [Arthrobacter sedimenti]|uniref:putative quinol monooxygenase n=1 Tax=Arthrobacter sedimenti TaxID=2694931 RepID=UPI000B35E3EF|nr:putative quinol monooxygenase [Arthrobacter sedimenti]OUM43996.1 antibiotic biosynthesis monooxygenase [Arthrobacter agilis]
MTDQKSGAVALYAEFTAKEGKADEVEALLLDLTTKVRAEPGNIVFDPHRRQEAPDDFFVYEIYRDDQAFQAHITADYGRVFNEALTDLIIGDGSQLTWLSPLT